MNLTEATAVLTLIIINSVLGVLLLVGKVRLAIMRPEAVPVEPADPFEVSEVVVPTFKTGKRGRPRKGEKRRIARHLHLPGGVTEEQLSEVAKHLKKYQDAGGDTIVLYAPSVTGPEHKIEVPYPVRWDDNAKKDFSKALGGWS